MKSRLILSLSGLTRLSCLVWLMVSAVSPANPCTLALISGSASAAGRALMWKNRDAPHVDNILRYFAGPKYGFIAVVNAEDTEGEEVWGGLNTAGFAIMNSLSRDLSNGGASDLGNGVFMKLALGECATVADFENLLLREKGKYALAANFGVIDAEGRACFFETGSKVFQKFDAADSRVAPFGYLVRTNFAFTSPDLRKGGGFIRFERISHLMEEASGSGRLDLRFLLQDAARDLVNEKLLSFPLRQSLSQDPAFPLYVHTNHTINRNSSVAALFFQGTSHKDRPDLATMWVVLGQPVTGVAIPLWPAAGKVPRIASGPGTAALNDLAKAVRSFIYPDSRGQMPQYLNVDRLRTYGGDGVLAKLIRIENRALSQASAALAAWKKKRPPQEKIAEVQEKIADDVFEAMAKEFSAVRIR